MPTRKRDPLWLTTIFLAGFAVLSLILVSSYAHELRTLKGDLYDRCTARQAYDQSSQKTREVTRDYWLAYIEAERLNSFIDDKLRTARIANAQRMVDANTDTLRKSVPTGCGQYR